MTAQAIYPFATLASGTLNPSIPINDNALRSQVKDVKALGIANSAPGSPSEDDQWIVGTTWGGFTTDNIVIYKGGAWLEFEPFDGQFKLIGVDGYLYNSGWNIAIPGSPNSIIDVTTFTANGATETANISEKGHYVRFTGTGSKSYTFNTSDGWNEGDRVWVTNRGGSGNLTIAGTGITFNGNPGTLAPGSSIVVIFTSATTADVIAYGGGGGGGGAVLNSFVRLLGVNGYGSTNTKIRRFTTLDSSGGSDITYADSASLGATFTINTTGLYSITYVDSFTGVSTLGVSLNSSQLTTNVQSITAANRLCEVSCSAASHRTGLSITCNLSAGDVIRAHTDGAAASGAAANCTFIITRIG